MDKGKRNILIVGHGAAAQALAKKLRTYNFIEKIYIARGDNIESDKYVNVDISEDDHTGLLKFVLENDITLTIPISNKALKSDIVSFFQANGQNIFGPTKKACSIALNKIAGKKFLYKIHAQTAKFAIFDKLQPAIDYLKTSNFPVIIQDIENNTAVCPTISLANRALNELITLKKEADVLVEEYTYGHNFTVYFVTDGYSAIPFATVTDFKFTQSGEAGELTNGIGCYVPDFKVSQDVIEKISKITISTINTLESKETPYMGILGIECILTSENKLLINRFKPFLQEHDASAVLNTVEENLINIFDSCIHGFFSDEYENINTNDFISASIIIFSKTEDILLNIEDTQDIDFINIKKSNDKFYTKKGKLFTITKCAKTLSRAKKYLKEELESIDFCAMKYRNDILKN